MSEYEKNIGIGQSKKLLNKKDNKNRNKNWTSWMLALLHTPGFHC